MLHAYTNPPSVRPISLHTPTPLHTYTFPLTQHFLMTGWERTRQISSTFTPLTGTLPSTSASTRFFSSPTAITGWTLMALKTVRAYIPNLSGSKVQSLKCSHNAEYWAGMLMLVLLISTARLAFCGTTGQLTFAFPFTEFLPLEQKIAFTANVRAAWFCQFLTELRLGIFINIVECIEIDRPCQ